MVRAHGRSQRVTAPRDKSRIRGLLGGRLKSPAREISIRDHIMAHALGGLDVNLFPQRPELNQGRSLVGTVYAEWSQTARTPGPFVFSRLIYADETWVPSSLEYGSLREDGTLWLERFAN